MKICLESMLNKLVIVISINKNGMEKKNVSKICDFNEFLTNGFFGINKKN